MSGHRAHTTAEAGHDPAVSHGLLLIVVVLVGLVGIVGMLTLSPQSALNMGDAPSSRLLDARIEHIDVLDAGANDPTLMPGALNLAITVSFADGKQVTFAMTDDTGDTFQIGQGVRVAELPDPGGGEPTYYINDFQRRGPLLFLLGLFLAAVIWFGRLQGVRALLGLATTLLIIIRWMIPAVLAGHSPILVALSGAAVIMIVTLYLSHGFHPKTTAAVVGTAAALALTGLLSWLFVQGAYITGMTSEEARMATFQINGLSLQGLLLAGIIIGGLGVLDDVTMSQASTVMELRRANPKASFGELMRGGIRVGRDHIAATVNTLFLAYAGASLPLLLLFTTSRDSFGTIVTSEVVAVEIVRTLVGSIGLIAAVPLTTALAAALVRPLQHGASAPDVMPAKRNVDVERDQVVAVEPPVTLRDEAGAETDEEWEQRLREAYRLPRREGQPED